MKDLWSSFLGIKSVLKKDPSIIVFCLIPVLLGLLIYFLLGHWIYGNLLDSALAWVESHTGEGWRFLVRYLLLGVSTVFMFFLVNWTFVLIVSLLSAPFNDLVSSRVEMVLCGKGYLPARESFRDILKRIRDIFINEIKKLSFVILFSLTGLVLGFFPLLTPLTFIISSLLVTINFIDYSWSRHKMSFRECLMNLKASCFSYIVAGGIFMILISLPFLNLVFLPLAVIYFTILFVKRSED